MIIDYDHNPRLTYDQKLQSLKESVQMALNEVAHTNTNGKNSSGSGGSGGALSYNDLANKPQIEGVTLMGNKMFPEINLNTLTNTEIQDIFDNLI